jgi:hypothetical protein
LVHAVINIDPQIQKYLSAPGKKLKGTLDITPENESGYYDIMVEDWSKGRKEGADWLKIKPARIKLKSGKTKKIKWKAVVPETTSGDLVAQIYVVSCNSKDLKGFKFKTRTAHGIYITIKDTAEPSVEIAQIRIEKQAREYICKTVLINTGNVHITTKGNMKITNQKTGSVSHLKLNPWFLHAGESSLLTSRLNNGPLKEGTYIVDIEVIYTDPIGVEHRLNSKEHFNIGKKGRILSSY